MPGVELGIRCARVWILALTAAAEVVLAADGAPAREEASAALDRAVAFFRGKVAVQGGYVWRYSADLSKREGEGKVGPTTAWVQPPGTPFVGEALVELYEISGKQLHLETARETAMALVRGQLRSGGWSANIEFDPAARGRYAYRTDGTASPKARDVSTLDDDMTQSALRCLMRYDAATKFTDRVVHEAALAGLESLLAAQFPNGGWAQVYRGPADQRHPVVPAGYSENGEYQRVKEYWEFYTLNDNVMSRVIETLFAAARVYGDDRYLAAARRGGKFLLLAQMPEPQPGWAQQYDFAMRPTWARKFEPPAISGGEGQHVLSTLLDLYERLGDAAYLEPIPRALRYYRRSLRPDGRLARFYELKSNRPLYFTRDYRLTYSDDDVPTHYSFTVESRLDQIEKRYERLAAAPRSAPREAERVPPRPAPGTVRRIIDALDERGAWVEDGRLRYWGPDGPTRRIIDPRTFVRNATALARYAYAE